MRYPVFFLEILPVDPEHIRSGLQNRPFSLILVFFRPFARYVHYVPGRQKQPFLRDFLFTDDTPYQWKLPPPNKSFVLVSL